MSVSVNAKWPASDCKAPSHARSSEGQGIWYRGLILVAAALVFAQQAKANDISGTWATGSEDGRVKIYRCGASLCGKLIDAARLRTNPDLRDVRNSDISKRKRRLKGMIVLQGFTGGPREWEGGPIYDPETGDGAKRGFLKLLPSGKLELKGCVGMFCRTKLWTRIR